MTVKLVDGNNYVRVLLETDPTGLAPRTISDATWSGAPQLWVWDGWGSLAKRRELYPAYKANRKRAAENIYATIDLVKQCLTHTPACQCTVDGYEADDVIASLAGVLTGTVEIYSNDLDFLQLEAKYPGRVFCGCNHNKISAEWLCLYKATVGDPSDNIPGIKGFGRGAWDAVDKDQLKAFIEGTSDIPPELKPGSQKWLAENLDQVRTYYKIVQFFDVPVHLMEIVIGRPDRNAVEAILKEFML